MAANNDNSISMTHLSDGSIRKLTVTSTPIDWKSILTQSVPLLGFAFKSPTTIFPADPSVTTWHGRI